MRIRQGQVRIGLMCFLCTKPARAGWSSKINQLLIGKALSDEFDDKRLNPCDVETVLLFL
jgi:hypothetical protein